MYCVDNASEFHHEAYLLDVIQAICGTDVALVFHPRDCDSHSAHCTVVNSETVMKPFKDNFSKKEAEYLVEQYPDENVEEDGQQRRNEKEVFHNGWCSSVNIGHLLPGDRSYESLPEAYQKMLQLTGVPSPRLHRGATDPLAKNRLCSCQL